MRVLITGATGLLGSDCAEVFGRRHEVVGWSRRKAPCSSALEQVDVTDPEAVLKGVSRFQPELILHCAAVSDVDRCEMEPEIARRFNRDAVANVARGAQEVQAYLIAISTDYVFDGRLDRPYREEDETGPLNTYGKAKLEGEKMALSFSPRSLVVRVSGLFGSARSNLVTQMVENFKASRLVPAVADQRYSPSYTVDVAQALARLVDHLDKLGGLLHVANSQGASREEVAQRIAQTQGFSARLIAPTTWAALQRPALRPFNSQLDCGRFSAVTGSSLRSWKEALDAFLKEER